MHVSERMASTPREPLGKVRVGGRVWRLEAPFPFDAPGDYRLLLYPGSGTGRIVKDDDS